LGFLLGGQGAQSRTKSFLTGVTVVLALILTIVAIGAIFAAGLRNLVQSVRWLPLAAGSVVIFLGLITLLGGVVRLSFPSVRLGEDPSITGYRGAIAYGVLFAPASLPCTFSTITSALVYSLTVTDLVTNLLNFLVFGFGYGLPLLVISALTGEARKRFHRRMLERAQTARRVSGILLVSAGAYLYAIDALGLSMLG